MSGDDPLAAFGYRPVEGAVVTSFRVSVAESLDPDSLQPGVMLIFRDPDRGGELGFPFNPDAAEFVAGQLLHWAAVSRAKSLPGTADT